jgi:ferredoxin--NADP+ reductase
LYEITHKQILSAIVKLIVVKAPHVATRAHAGQFLIVRIDEAGERIPLTIADSDPSAGTVTLIFQEVGKSTRQMGMLNVGDKFKNVVGPLGHPTDVLEFGKVILVGGGVGIAPLYPIARALKDAGNTVVTIIGARTKELLFWEDRMRACSDQIIICTDDGSYGRKGLVTEPLKELLLSEKDIVRAWAIGPAIMMKFVAETTRPFKLPTLVSLNTIMVDGTGMCGGCRVVLDDGAQFVCVDGPEFDAHRVNWNLLLERLSFYRVEELQAVKHWESHNCQLDQVLKTAGMP